MASSGVVVLSAVGGGTTGGVRRTKLSKRATLKVGAEILSRVFLMSGTPHKNTITVSSSHGVHAARSFAALGSGVIGWGDGASLPCCSAKASFAGGGARRSRRFTIETSWGLESFSVIGLSGGEAA